MTVRASSSVVLRAVPPASSGQSESGSFTAHAPAAGSAGTFVDWAKATPLPRVLWLRSGSVTPGFERHCIAEFEHLAQSSPSALVDLALRELTDQPVLLAQAAEALSLTTAPAGVVRSFLLDLLSHPRPFVREGAIVGLASLVDVPAVRAMLEKLAREDLSPGVREAAADVLALS